MDGEDASRQVEGLCLSNETLVLRAENSIFRVLKSMLAARLTVVFETMSEFPPPASDGEEIMDGSPVVLLHDSTVEFEARIRFQHTFRQCRAIFDSKWARFLDAVF
jgi:hypothetical protein